MLVRQLSVLGLAAAASAAPSGKQRRYAPTYSPNPERAAGVKEAFNFAWDGYYKNAFPHDSYKPVSNSYQDDRNGWGASAVDAFSTAVVMGNQEVIDQILAFIPTINFDHTDTEVSLFETTIRYLGGMLSGYDLLKGPQSKFNSNDTAVDAVLAQAKRLADNLKVAFDTPTGIPDNSVFLKDKPERGGSETNGIATIGTLILEWQRLSDLTGDSTYGDLAKKGMSYLIHPTPQYNEPWPGLIGTNFGISNGSMLDASGGWTGGTDSFYEYELKMYLYNKGDFGEYLKRWQLAAKSSIDNLASHPSSREDLTFLAYYRNHTLDFYSENLACFDGGSFILGGLTTDNQDLIDFGLELTASCHATYNATATHIGPDSFNWEDSVLKNSSPPQDQADYYAKNGYWTESPGYYLRPEVIESYYYAYRATGDTKYQDWTWDFFTHLNSTCRVGGGFSSINDVNDPSQGYGDDQESFLFAEVMKYSYIIFADDADWQVKADKTNKFVYNTECHPVRIANDGTA